MHKNIITPNPDIMAIMKGSEKLDSSANIQFKKIDPRWNLQITRKNEICRKNMAHNK
ncbi:MAG: hypothetical protein JXR78_07885 [Victivallales bacterium]|nr:hypothetical protein [Victivallales bacterium]